MVVAAIASNSSAISLFTGGNVPVHKAFQNDNRMWCTSGLNLFVKHSCVCCCRRLFI